MLGLALYTIRHLFAPGLPTGWDTLGHWAKVVYLKQELLPHGLWDGWYPYWHGGFQLFQFYPPLFYHLVVWSTGLGGLTTAFKWWTALSYLLLPVAAFVWARAFRLGRMAAFGAAMATLFIDTTYGAGITGTFAIGLLPNALGLALFPLVLSAYHRAHDDSGWIWLSGALFGTLLLAHTFTSYYTSLALALYSLFQLRDRPKQTLQAGLGTLLLGLGLGSFWLIPALTHYDDHGLIGQWQTSDLGAMLQHLVTGKSVGDLVVTMLGAIGLWVALGKGKSGSYLAALWLLTAGLSLGLGRGWLPFGDVVGSSQFLRFQACLGLVTALMAGIALQGFKDKGLWGKTPLAIAFLALALVSWPHLQQRANGFVRVTSDFSQRHDVEVAADWIKSRIQPGERALGEFSWDVNWTYGSPHVTSQALALAGVEDLAGNFPEGSPMAEATLLWNQNLTRPELAEKLRPFGVRYVLAVTAPSHNALSRNPDLELAYVQNSVAVFRLKTTQLAVSDPPVAVDHVQLLPQGRLYRLTSQGPSQVRLPLGHLSTWHLTINDKPWTFHNDQEQVAFRLPGKGTWTVRLVHVPQAWEKQMVWVSWLTGMWIVGGWFVSRRRRA